MCLFCKIANKEIPATIAYEDEDAVAFHDINPAAPKHVLVIPRKHIASLTDMTDADTPLLGKLLAVARRVAEAEGLTGSGFRVVLNTGPHAGQSVFHVHVHVLGGRLMAWPPG